jgi:hypothetical protein
MLFTARAISRTYADELEHSAVLPLILVSLVTCGLRVTMYSFELGSHTYESKKAPVLMLWNTRSLL